MNNTLQSTDQYIQILKVSDRISLLTLLKHYNNNTTEQNILHHSLYVYSLPRTLMFFAKKSYKYDRELAKAILMDVDFLKHIQIVTKNHNFHQTIKWMFDILNIKLPNKTIIKMITRVNASNAKEEETDNLQLQFGGFFKVGLDSETLDTIDDISEVVNDKLPDRQIWSDLLVQFTSFSESSTNSMNKLSNTVETVLENPMFAGASKIAETISDFPSAKETLSLLAKGVSLGGVTYSLYKITNEGFTKTNSIILSLSLALAIQQYGFDNISILVSDLGSSLMSILSTLSESTVDTSDKGESIELQGQFSDDFFGKFTFFNANYPKSFIDKLNALLRLNKDFPTFLTDLFELFKALMNTITENLFGYTTFESCISHLDLYDNKYKILMEEYHQQELHINAVNAARLQFLISAYENILKKLDGQRKANLSKLIDGKVISLRKIDKLFTAYSAVKAGVRQEPVSILIKGDPGTFKSVLVTQLQEACLQMSLPSEELKKADGIAQYIYHRNSGQEFYDGFSTQTEVCVMDDFGQTRDQVGMTTTDFSDLISMHNTTRMLLNMAHLDQKGTVDFKAKWILATTNLDKIVANSIVCVQAVIRRFDLIIRIIPNEKYAKLDKEAGTRIFDDDRIKTHIEGVKDITMDKFDYQIVQGPPEFRGKEINSITLIRLMRKIYTSKVDRFAYNIATAHKIKALVSDMMRETEEVECQGNSVAVIEPEDFDWDSCSESEAQPFNWKNTILSNVSLVAFSRSPQEALAILQREIEDGVQAKFIRDIFLGTGTTFKVPVMDALYYQPSEQVEKHLLRILDPYVYDFYRLLYGYYLSAHGDYDRTFVPKQYLVHDPFILFCIISSSDLMNADRLFAGQRFNISIVDSKLSVCYDLTLSRKLREFDMSVRSGIIRFLTTLNPTSRVVCTIVMGGVLWYAQYKVYTKAISMSISLFRYLFTSTVQVQSIGPKFDKTKVQHLNMRSKTVQERLQLQGLDTNGMDIVKSITKTSVSLFDVIQEDGTMTSLGSILWLNTESILMPEHYFTKIMDAYDDDEEGVMKLRILISDKGVCVHEDSFVSFFMNNSYHYAEGDSHLIFVRLRRSPAKERKDILKHFCVDADIASISNADLHVSLVVNSSNFQTMTSTASIVRVNELILKIDKGVKYFIDTDIGDCGMPLMIRDPRFGCRRILGIHVAGTPKHSYSKVAYSTLVTKELILQGLSKLDQLIVDVNVDDDDILLQSGGVSQYCHSPYQKSQIVPSILATTSFPRSNKVPALLYYDARNDLDPYSNAIKHYYPRVLNYDEDILNRAVCDYQSFICSFPWELTEDIMDLPTVLWGDARYPYRKAIPCNTSPGYPLKFTDPTCKKRLLGENVERSIHNPEYASFSKTVDSYLTLLNKGVRSVWIYTDNLKDSLVTKEKRESGDSRLFSGSPFYLFVLKKMLYGHFVEFLSTKCVSKGTAMSMNVYGHEWSELAHELSKFDLSVSSTYCLSVDYKKFDACQTKMIILEALRVINGWYTYQGKDQHNLARSTLMMEVYNSHHIANYNLYEWLSSMPSGSYLTLVVNCLVNQIINRYSYYLEMGVSYSYPFHVKVFCCVQGDDNILCVSTDIRNKFNGLSLKVGAHHLGFVITSDDKTELSVEWKHISECSFLKRNFNIERDQIYPALSLETIMTTPLWSKRGSYYHKTTIDAIKFFFRELSMHTKEVFEKYTPYMRIAIRESNIAGIDNLHDPHHVWRSRVLNSEPFIMEL